ncbi:MAG: tyrosine-type recombinase/integrase [Dehalococcoidia bacterium]
MSRARRGAGSIRQRPDGLFEARVSVIDPTTGKTRRRSYYGKTQDEVIGKLAGAIVGRVQGLPAAQDGRRTVRTYLQNEWLPQVRTRVRASTYAGYEATVRLHIVPTIGNVPLSRLGTRDVRRMLAAMLEPDESGTKRAARTAQLTHAILRAALNDAMRDELVGRNVATLVRGPRVDKKPVDPIGAEEIRKFLEAVRGDRLEALYVCAFTTGARQGELLGLRWSDIDWDAGTLRISHALRRGDRTFGPPKGDRSLRAVPLTPRALEALEAHRQSQPDFRLLLGKEWKNLVFTTSVGTPLDGRNVTRMFQAHLERAGIRSQRFHDMRHAAASLMLAEGMHPRAIMETLGHSQIALTMNTYSHVSDAMRREVADAMQRALG